MGLLRILFRRRVAVVPPVIVESETSEAELTLFRLPERPTPPRPATTRPAFTPYPDRAARARLAEAAAATARANGGHRLVGKCFVIDGDTIVIGHVHVRLAGIDAPELEHAYGQKAKWALHALCKDQEVTAEIEGELSHGRVVAVCRLPDGRDLAAELVRRGLALDWPAFSGGRYRHLETGDARRKLWRAAARQRPN